jgi:hypothetical protein
MTMIARRPEAAAGLAFADPASAVRVHAEAPLPPSDIPQDPRWAVSNLPQSGVREEHAQSGQWRDDAPSAVTGR